MYDRAQFRGRFCPHMTFTGTADERWGVAHQYVLRAFCNTCGPVRETIFHKAT